MSNREFFSHDSDAFYDEKIVGMCEDFGFESYGLWWFIIERMRKETDFKLAYHKKTFRSIQLLTRTSIDVEEFINSCINDYELFILEDDKFYSKSFLNRMNIMIEKQQKKSEQARIAGKKSAEVRRQKKQEKLNDSSTDFNECSTDVEQMLKKKSTDVERPLKNSSTDFNECSTDFNETQQNKIKLNKIKLNNNISLHYTTLDLLFNYLIYKETHFENLTDADRNIIVHHLKRLNLYFDDINNNMDCIPEDKLFETKIYYWVVTSIWMSEYKVYIENLKATNLSFRFMRCKKYISINPKSSESDLKRFISYLIKSIMEDMKND